MWLFWFSKKIFNEELEKALCQLPTLWGIDCQTNHKPEMIEFIYVFVITS